MGKLENCNEAKNGSSFLFSGTDVQAVSMAVSRLFEQNGYKLEKGVPENAVYGRGNAVLRILFGAFVKRHKYSIRIFDEAGNVRMELQNAMSGISGGAIGMASMRKELQRISDQLKTIRV